MNKVKVTLQKISPIQAQRYLEHNKKNRRLNEGVVNFYLDQMRKDQWLPTGDTIKFAINGDLLDGQHRLAAIAKHTEPVDVFVAENIEPEAFKVIDTGKSRSAGDVVRMTGMKNAYTVAGTVRAILLYKLGRYYSANKKKEAKGVSNTDILEFIDKHPRVGEIVVYVQNLCYQFPYVPASGLAMLYYVLSAKNQTKADTFFGKYGTGIDLSERSPIKGLRDRLMRDPQNKTKLTYRDKLALVIFAWNAYLKGKELGIIKIHGEYTFPTPI